jgi:hypothetical protein
MCRLLLSTVSVAYRPLHLAELGSLCKLRGPVSTLTANTRTLVAMCGSFLTIRDDQVYLIHQSAKDYLDDEARAAILLDKGEVHYKIFSQSLKLMSSTLKRDMYGLGALGCPIEKVTRPATDPLATARYSCVHWIDHLYESTINKNGRCNKDLQDDGTLHAFLQACYLYWLEALSLCKSISAGVAMMGKLEILLQVVASHGFLLVNHVLTHAGKNRRTYVNVSDSRRTAVCPILQASNRGCSAAGIWICTFVQSNRKSDQKAFPS